MRSQGNFYSVSGLFLALAIHLFAPLAMATPPADDSAIPGAGASPKPAAEGATTKANTVPGAEQVDQVVTNNYLRALSGSTSRWSFASQSNYQGGTLGKPFDQDRPDISNASATTTKSDFDSSISAKFNIDAFNSLSAGGGLRWVAPFYKNTPGYGGKRFDIFNPWIQYQYIYGFLGVQSLVQVQFTQWTQTDQTARGYAQTLNLDQESVYELGKTGLSFGISAYIQYTTFNKSGDTYDPVSGTNLDVEQSMYEFYIAPVLEYKISEKVNLRTLCGLLSYEHYRNQKGALAFVPDGIYQSVGLGISVTRDIYVYPNIQFLPGQIQSPLTNVGLGATINLF